MEKILNKNLKILIITQYFWPENFRINELTEELVKRGNEITILTGYPNYPKGEIYKDFKKNKKKFSHFKGAQVVRVPLIPRRKGRLNLAINYLSFLINSIILGSFFLRKKNFDVLFTFQLSPVTVGITSAFFSFIKNCPQVFWVLDLWPDTLVALEIIKKKWQIKLFKKLVNWIYSKCNIIFAQSKNILKEIKKYSAVKSNAFYLPSWGESDSFFKEVLPAPEITNKNIFTILFAGNIGDAQDLLSLVKAVQVLKEKKISKIRIILIGDGSKKEWIRKEIKKLSLENYFEFYSNYPFKRMPSFFLHSDVLFVSLLNKKVFNMTVPGKIQLYLSSGIPIIGMLGGEGADIIRDSKSGLVCEPGDYLSLSEIIIKMMRYEKGVLKKMGMNGKKYAEREFSKDVLIDKLNHILHETSRKNKL